MFPNGLKMGLLQRSEKQSMEWKHIGKENIPGAAVS